MLFVRHHTAAGGVGPWWRYDSVRKVVFLVTARSTTAIDVCSTFRPRFGAYALTRQNACVWHIVPARYSLRSGTGTLITQTRAFSEALGVETIALTDAPEQVALELAELGR